LVSDLLDLSRIEAGRYPIKLQRLKLRASLKRSVDLVERPAREKGLSVRLSVDEAATCAGDPRAFEQVIANLLDNAVKYTPAGGQIEVRAKPVEEGVRVEVVDDGPGIEPRHRDRIFERFYRVDPGRSRDVGGTGLGLSIVKHLVEAMAGNVGLEPNTPQGSIFWFVLPVGEGSPAEEPS
jgi:two-component system phosphate regulon sensor histidine kinase PhoR